tara:strand:+ start:1177 stop:2313 length:1137 start_codon:yes stop_codon:yes gene_type:complete
MADIAIWEGDSTFAPGQTPFSFYDNDSDFQADADKVSKFCAQRLGYPLMDVELQSGSFYACFEEAVTTYGNEVFQYKIRENYLSMEGDTTGSSFNNKLIEPGLGRTIQITENYGTEAGVGGSVTKYTGELNVSQSVQEYDLEDALGNLDGGVEIRKVFFESPPAILRYFDPYAGTGTGIQSLMDAFDFGSYSPGINFLLMPASYDMLKVQAIEFNDQIRRSAYSFELVNNKLKLFPIPSRSGKVYFEYYKNSEKSTAVRKSETNLITNVGEVPYDNVKYAHINSVGRQWVYRYTLALTKELLGYIRGKYQQIPVPGSNTALNQADLLTDARTEKTALLTELREMLDQTSRTAQLERKANESDNLKRITTEIPMTIFIG